LPPDPIPYPIPFIEPPLPSPEQEKPSVPDGYFDPPPGSTDLGQILGKSTCVLICLMKKYPERFMSIAIENAAITWGASFAGPEGIMIVLTIETISDTITTQILLNDLKDCIECECGGN
jgi:hypothetical protein